MAKTVSYTFATGIIALGLVLLPADSLHNGTIASTSESTVEPVYITVASGGIL